MNIPPERLNCTGCTVLEEYEGIAECMDMIYWKEGTPANPPCYQARQMEMTPEFKTAMSKCLRLVETLGLEHPEVSRAMMIAMALAPDEFKDEMADEAQRMGLIPETDGYLEDGTPMIRLEDLAEKLGVPLEDTQEKLQIFLAEREALGLSNDGIVTNPALVHRKH
ncbi:MAG: hypothetical protein EPN94_12635 [Nitrospirae bacterium]|nr:MAG: hypothetical protein EPN94_12635 [Nitrospirota bacterium]